MPIRDLSKRRRWLLEQMPVGGVCAEIGVWKGDFAHWILEINRPRVLHLIDPWAYSAGERYAETWHGGESEQRQQELDQIHASVVERFAEEISRERVVIHRAPSAEAVGAFEDAMFDWIYIDGDHFYDAVKKDLNDWERTIKPGGIIAGDDYRESRVYGTDVVRAVDEFAAARGLKVEAWGRQFLMRLPG